MGSNFISANESKTVKRRQSGSANKIYVKCPIIISHYNKGMGGVDLMDQKKVYYEYSNFRNLVQALNGLPMEELDDSIDTHVRWLGNSIANIHNFATLLKHRTRFRPVKPKPVVVDESTDTFLTSYLVGQFRRGATGQTTGGIEERSGETMGTEKEDDHR